MKVGYARVSDADQHLDAQLARLAGCDKVYCEKLSGVDRERPRLKEALAFVREGDSFVVTRLDRLARSVHHLCEIKVLLEHKQVPLVVLEQNIDTGTATGALLFHMVAAIAEFERALLLERQREGIAKARERGVKFGQPMALSSSEVEGLQRDRALGYSIGRLSRIYGLSERTVYRYLGRDMAATEVAVHTLIEG